MPHPLKSFLINCSFGVLLVFSLAPFYVFPLLICALSGLLWQIHQATNLKSALWRSFSFGFGYYMAGLCWIGVAFLYFPNPVYPNKWLGGMLAVPALISLVSVFSLYFILLGWISWHLPKKGFKAVLSQSALWTFISFLQGYLFTGFPWNPLAISLTFHPIPMQLAAFIGVYGLTWIAAFIGYSFYGFKGQFKKKPFFISLAMLIVLACISAGRYYYYDYKLQSAPKIATIRAIQTGISMKDKWDNKKFYQHLMLINDLLNEQPADYDAAILGESALPIFLDQEPKIRDILSQFIPQGTHLLIGTNQLTDNDIQKPRNTLAALDTKGDIIHSYSKSHLVPFGEYTPKWIPFKKFVPVPGVFVQGNGPQTYRLNKFSYGPNICYEGIFSGAVIDEKNKPDVMINIATDAWYGNSHGPRQHAAQQILRAVEEGLPLVRVTGNGISFAANAIGKTEKKLKIGRSSYFDYSFSKQKIITFSSRQNQKFIFILTLTIILCSLYCEKRRIVIC